MQDDHPQLAIDRSVIFDEICAVLRKYNRLNVTLAPETRITSDLDIDSVGVMDAIMEVEEKFNIDIPVNHLSDVETIGDLTEIVYSRVGTN